MDPQIRKENMHRFSAFKDRSKMFKTMSTILYGPCEVLGGDSDTETTTEFNIFVETGKT